MCFHNLSDLSIQANWELIKERIYVSIQTDLQID